MKVLVTGGTGFLGAWVIRKLLDEGHEVRVIKRDRSDISQINNLEIEYVNGDVCDFDSMDKACQNVDTVFHLAGLIAYKKSQYKQMFQINVEGTRNIIRACDKNHISKILYASSVVCMGASFTPETRNEDSSFNLAPYKLGYFDSKLEAESLILNAYNNQILEPIIVNPATIYGPGDARKGSRKTQVKVAQGKFPFYTKGGVNIIGVQECVEGIWSAFQSGAPGRRYILAGENITIKELFGYIAEAADVSAPNILLPNFILRGVGKFGDMLEYFNLKGPISSENAITASLYHWFDNQRAKEELGLKVRSAKDCIVDSVEWMKQQGLLRV